MADTTTPHPKRAEVIAPLIVEYAVNRYVTNQPTDINETPRELVEEVLNELDEDLPLDVETNVIEATGRGIEELAR